MSCRASCASSTPAPGSREYDLVFLGVPVGRARRGRRRAALARAEAARRGRLAGQGPRAAGRALAVGRAARALRRRSASPSSAAPRTRARWSHEGAGLVAASENEELARLIARTFIRAGVVCEESNDPVGVELAGAAKNAAALASGATEAQGLNAAGAAAGHIFAEVWRFAEARGARPESMIGLAGTGDLVATALAPGSRNRRAGELLAQGVPAAEIPERIGQAVESLDLVPLLDRALPRPASTRPSRSGLARLISGELPLDDWVALVRTTVPPRARWRAPVRRGLLGAAARALAGLARAARRGRAALAGRREPAAERRDRRRRTGRACAPCRRRPRSSAR